MSRSNYDDCCDGWDLIRWRGAVASAIRGGRGQAFLKEMAAALDAMPEKRLIEGAIKDNQGDVCAIGCVALSRQTDTSKVDDYNPDSVAKAFGIAPALAQEIAFINDDWAHNKTPEQRWQIVRQWVQGKLA